eukprot:1203900-Rhodomonas_salina.2
MDRKVFLAARVRPLTEQELHLHGVSCIVIDQEGSCITLVNPENGQPPSHLAAVASSVVPGDAKAYVLDHVYDSTSPPEKILPKKAGTGKQPTLAGQTEGKKGKEEREPNAYADNDALFRDMGVPLLAGALELSLIHISEPTRPRLI